MTSITITAHVGDDHVLHVRLPDDAPTGAVTVTVEQPPADEPQLTGGANGASGLLGIFTGPEGSVEQFLRERREEDASRERWLARE